ncbi:MAG: threonylcarbamoyl-AMP synthase [Eubacterium sp.]|nr:threonylcarbamoyl-AMP synthase [Eubacterium sp.]MBR7060307.1 threonylcarbamoyl-AMP synthase [Eubacterium sp.]
METKILSTSKQDIALAGKILRGGGLVAFPTETVYGLGANAFDEEAVKSIYRAKGRPSDNPLIVHIAKKEDIAPLVEEIPEKAQKLIDAFFPAPLTIILKKSPLIGKTVSGGLETVAFRMPKNEIARAVIEAAGVPIAAPSANTSGLPSPTKASHVIDDMQGKIEAIVDGGDCEFGVESTVITLAEKTPVILRPGAITKEMIEKVIGKTALAKAVLSEMEEGEKAASPGMKYKHYSPKAKVFIVDADKKTYENFVNSKKGAFALCFEEDEISIPKVVFGKENDDLSQAKLLFDKLRELDELGAKKVYARIPNKDGIGTAVYNRLIRAAAFNIIDLKKPFTIGLTGQTGAGKGYVCEELEKLGFKIINSDFVARKLTEKGSPLLGALQKSFGEDILENGELNRKLLAKRAFENKEKTALLNSVMHPAIIEECKKQSRHPCVFDAPQLFEAKAEDLCYKIICVSAPAEKRLERIMKRDNISEEDALLRINAQFDEKYYIDRSDYVIYNNGQNINEQINRILEVIL